MPQEAEISSDLAARIAFAEEAAREDRDRMVRNEHFVAFLAGFPPDQLGQLFNGFPPEGIVNFLKKIPELPGLTTRWAEQYFEFLNRPDIGQDIERLESRGARKEPIAIAMIAIRFSPMFDNMFAQFGDKRERVQRAKRLLVPLPELSALASMFGDIPALLSRKMPNPSLIISDLKLLSALFELGEFTYDSLGANHLLEVSKFALASLVHETTGQYLDRLVSNLTSAALNDYDYDENRHRVWRNDNYERLQRNVPIVTSVLGALNTVIASANQP